METIQQKRNHASLLSFLVLLIAMLALSFWLLSPFLLSIIMGGIISLMLRPSYERLLAKKWKPKLAALFMTLVMVLLFIVPLVLLGVMAAKQGAAIGHAIAADEHYSPQVMMTRVVEWPPMKIFIADATMLEEKSKAWAEDSLKLISGGLLTVFSGIPGVILQMVLTALSCFVFLLSGKTFVKWMKSKIPLEHEVRKKLSLSFVDTAVSTIWATLGAGAAQSIVMLVAFLILQIPAAFLAAGLTFILAWIPMVGCSPVWVVAALYLISQGAVGKAVAIVVFGLAAGIVDNIVRPMILKGRSRMHPLVSLISIFAGIGLFGIVGVFIGPVLASIQISLLVLWEEIGTRYELLPKDAE